MLFEFREVWLAASVEYFTPDFAAHGYPLKAKVRVTCGWPSKGALALKARRIGECWHPRASEDGAVEIFISPVLADPIVVGHVLVHELCHAATGNCGHREPFRSLALKMGLTGPMRSTTPGDQLIERLNALSREMGPYPHAQLNANSQDRKKQGTRLLKCECLVCGYTVRITKKWIDEVGLPVCPNDTHPPATLARTQPIRGEIGE